MSYNTVESGLLTVIQVLSNYDGNNSSRGDYRILGKGNSRNVILNPGSIPSREIIAAPRRVGTIWEIIIELHIPFSGEISTVRNNLRTDRQELLDHIDKYPTLNGVSGVTHAFITSGREPFVWQGESSNYWVQHFICRVSEHTTITIAE